MYLMTTSGMGLVLGGRGPVVLTGHADASWVDDSATQQSSQGYTFSLGSGSVSWRSTRSSSVLSSSCQAKIYAEAMAAQELHWLTYLLTELGEQPRSPPVLYVDNKAMIALCEEHRLEHRTKHIALRYFLARDLQQRGQLRLAYVATRANTADIFTKALLLACLLFLTDLDISLHRPPGFTVSFPARTQWSFWRPVYGLRHAPREWHDTLRASLVALGFTPSTSDPSLFLRTDTSLPPFFVIVYVLQRFGFHFSSPHPTPLSTGHLLSTPPSDESVELSAPTLAMGLVLGGRGPVVLTGHADPSWVDDLATQRSSKGYTFSLGSSSVSWRSTRSSSVLSSCYEAEIYEGAKAA
ncbi:unnamed protein product [Closterium sp. NIES-53]